MRIDDVVKSNQDIQKKFRLASAEGRELATLSVLTDISETLAIIADIYGISHGRVISKIDGIGEANAEP